MHLLYAIVIILGSILGLLFGATLVAMMLACCLGLCLLLVFNMLFGMSPGRLTDAHRVFIAADAKTAWDTYFVHVRKADFRPGTRILGAEILSEDPLTVKATMQCDFATESASTVFTYDLYEPYRRYRLKEGDTGIIEEGEFRQEPGGTWLRFTVDFPRMGRVLHWAAQRRTRQNLRALKDVCEGRQPKALRGAFPAPPWWWRSNVAFFIGLGLSVALLANLPRALAGLLGVALIGLLLVRPIRWLGRFLAIP